MTRFTTLAAFAFGCAALTAYAQDTTVKSTTKSSGGAKAPQLRVTSIKSLAESCN